MSQDENKAIVEALLEIRADLQAIKKRLSISDHDHDHQDEDELDHDHLIKIIRSDMISMGMDPDEYDLLEGIRTVKYYLEHKWRLTNPKAYLTKALGKFRKRSHPGLVSKALENLPEEDGAGFQMTDEVRANLAEKFPQFRQMLEKNMDGGSKK